MAATTQQRGRVAAGARGGTAEVDAYDQAAQDVRSSRNAAVAAMQREAAQFGAPGALIAQLNAQLQAPAQVELGNIASLGATARNMAQSTQQGSDVYKLQAAEAGPVIDAQANRDLGQQLAMIQAEHAGDAIRAAAAHRSSGGGGYGGLSDSELRTRIMGLAIQQRQGMLGQATQAFRSAMNRQPETPTPVPMTQEQIDRLGPPGPARDRLVAMHEARARRIHTTIQGIDEPKKTAYFTFRNAIYGPGIANEAQQIALRLGIDPATAYGLFTPAVDQEYVNANKATGMYVEPGTKNVGVTGQILSPFEAGQKLLPSGERLSQADVGKSMGQQYFDWNGDSTLATAFSKWAQSGAMPANLTNAPLEQQHAAFEADPQNRRFQRPVVDDIVGNLQQAAQQGWGIDAAWNRLQTDPAFQLYPREFALALTMAAPLFSYYAAVRTKMATPGVAADASYDPTASYPLTNPQG